MAAVGSRLLSHNNFWPNIKPQKEVKLEIGPGRAALALQVGMENFALQLAGNFSDGLQARNTPMSWKPTQSAIYYLFFGGNGSHFPPTDA